MNVLLLDANNLINRAFYAIPLMFSKVGVPNNGLKGFANTVLNLKEENNIDIVVGLFDNGIPSWRMEAAPLYKSNRGEKPIELQIQLEIAEKELCGALGVHAVKKENTEADDLLYTLALRCYEAGHSCFIASGDKDIVQCLSIPNTILLRPPKTPSLKWEKIRKEDAERVLGVPPEKIPDFLAIVGDKVDNLIGINGVGPKTAIKWLKEYKNIYELASNKSKIAPRRLAERIDLDMLENNLKVTKSYDTDAKLPTSTVQVNTEKLKELGIYKAANRIIYQNLG